MNSLGILVLGILLGAVGLFLAAWLVEAWQSRRARRRRRWQNGGRR